MSTSAKPKPRSSTGAKAMRPSPRNTIRPEPRIASPLYRTMPRPVSQPLVTSWNARTMPYAVHQVRVRTSAVRRMNTSARRATSTATAAAAVYEVILRPWSWTPAPGAQDGHCLKGQDPGKRDDQEERVLLQRQAPQPSSERLSGVEMPLSGRSCRHVPGYEEHGGRDDRQEQAHRLAKDAKAAVRVQRKAAGQHERQHRGIRGMPHVGSMVRWLPPRAASNVSRPLPLHVGVPRS